MRRRVVLDNKTRRLLRLKEVQQYALEGVYGHETRVDPYDVVLDFPATFYQDRSRDSRRASRIVIFSGEDEAEMNLYPDTFVQFVKLIFKLEDPDHLVVYGVRPRLTYLCRFSGFGFLGREYTGRTEELLFRTRLIRV